MIKKHLKKRQENPKCSEQSCRYTEKREHTLENLNRPSWFIQPEAAEKIERKAARLRCSVMRILLKYSSPCSVSL